MKRDTLAEANLAIETGLRVCLNNVNILTREVKIDGLDVFDAFGSWDLYTPLIALSDEGFTEEADVIADMMFRSQWKSSDQRFDGFLPHITVPNNKENNMFGRNWGTKNHPASPADSFTSSITQPPLQSIGLFARALAESSEAEQHRQLDKFTEKEERHLLQIFRTLQMPDGNVVGTNAYSTGRDDDLEFRDYTLSLKKHMPFLGKVFGYGTHLPGMEKLSHRFRRDIPTLEAATRMPTRESIWYNWPALTLSQARLGLFGEDVLAQHPYLVADPGFNACLLESCEVYLDKMRILEKEPDDELLADYKKLAQAFPTMWLEDGTNSRYCAQAYEPQQNGSRLRTPLTKHRTLNEVLPLIWRGTPDEHKIRIIHNLDAVFKIFDPLYLPIPSASPLDLGYNSRCYWKGASWKKPAFLVVCALKRDEHLPGATESAAAISFRTLGVAKDPRIKEPTICELENSMLLPDGTTEPLGTIEFIMNAGAAHQLGKAAIDFYDEGLRIEELLRAA